MTVSVKCVSCNYCQTGDVVHVLFSLLGDVMCLFGDVMCVISFWVYYEVFCTFA